MGRVPARPGRTWGRREGRLLDMGVNGHWLMLIALSGLSCTPGAYGPRGRAENRTRFNQSCGAACAALNPTTGELLAPGSSQAGHLAGKAIEAAEAVQGLAAVERALSGTQLDQVERILKECVAQAHADVNESYQKAAAREFRNGKFPNDAECDRTVRYGDQGHAVSLARELGVLKHAAAFACLESRLSSRFRGNFSVEPRYRGDPESNGVVLTSGGEGSLSPDVVVHAMRNAAQVQCVYEIKFPCLERHRLDPLGSPGVTAQLDSYQGLSWRCPVALVTPTGLHQFLP